MIQYSRSFDSGYGVSFQRVCVAYIARDLVSRWYVEGGVESSNCRWVCATKLGRRFPKALRLVEKRNDVAASEEPSASRDALGVTHFANALPSSVGEHDMLLYSGAALAHTFDRKKTATFNGRALYSDAASLFRAQRRGHSHAREKHSLSFGEFLLTEIPQTMTLSMLVEKIDLNTVSVFFHNPAYGTGNSTARAKTPA